MSRTVYEGSPTREKITVLSLEEVNKVTAEKVLVIVVREGMARINTPGGYEQYDKGELYPLNALGTSYLPAPSGGKQIPFRAREEMDPQGGDVDSECSVTLSVEFYVDVTDAQNVRKASPETVTFAPGERVKGVLIANPQRAFTVVARLSAATGGSGGIRCGINERRECTRPRHPDIEKEVTAILDAYKEPAPARAPRPEGLFGPVDIEDGLMPASYGPIYTAEYAYRVAAMQEPGGGRYNLL
ncbi:hypothetical protein ABH931_002690 [Streptacidiphilus sp. MAP12-33]|uniref:hypothetical protein n=1 Tax=Streptacidiphilus sp. MAP12-33 TaxID=3156266 RepID=UPI00351559D3